MKSGPFSPGRMLPFLRHCCAFGSHNPSTWRSIFQTPGREQKHIRSWSAHCSANNEGASVLEKDNSQKKLALPDNSLIDARILYCTSPALGHNKVRNYFFYFKIHIHVVALMVINNLLPETH